MGCDIHCYIEFNDFENIWSTFGGRINPGRSYTTFAKLAGVRSYNNPNSPLFVPPRGVPENVGYSALGDYTFFVTEDEASAKNAGMCWRPDAERWVASGYAEWVDEENGRVTCPDWHTASWLTTEEYRHILALLKIEDDFIPRLEYLAMLAAMERFEEHGKPARLVFWFDN